jgi:FkbM family methyltransferase
MELIKKLVRRSIRGLGYDLRQRRPELIDFLKARNINLVIDVGANRGQFALGLRSDGYCGSIVSFEPAIGPYQELMRLTSSDERWKSYHCALGERSGRTKLNISLSDTFSSILDQTTNAYAFEQSSAVTHVEDIDIFRLDDVCPLRSSDRAFLKIDTQGFEKEVLAGASIALKSLFGVLMEIPVVHMYKNVWSFEEAVAFMKSAGFVPAQITPVNFLWRQDPVCVSEFDCLFRRVNVELDSCASDAAGNN